MDKHVVIGARKDGKEFTVNEANRIVVLRLAADSREKKNAQSAARPLPPNAEHAEQVETKTSHNKRGS